MSQFTVAEVEAGALRRDGTSTIQEVTVIDNTLHLALHRGMNELRRSGELCDVSLCVEDTTFPCHRVVLAAFSPYFRAMFVGRLCESEQRQVNISGVEAHVMELLLDFAYTASITINTSNVQSLLSGAHLLTVVGVVTACCRFLEHQLEPSNALGILQLADTLQCDDLKAAAQTFVNSEFDRVLRESEELLDQSVSSLVAVLSSPSLCVGREEDVFTAVMRWMHHDHPRRAPHLHKVLQWVRLCQVSPYFLVDVVEAEPAVRSSAECRVLVEEARLYHLLPDRRQHYHSKSTQPRPRPTRTTTMGLVAVCGEDPSGVYQDVHFFDPSLQNWIILTNVPEPLHGMSACVLGGGQSLLVSGSGVSRLWRNLTNFVFYKFDAMLEHWMQLQPMNTPRYKPVTVCLNGNIYCVGGHGALDRDPLDLHGRPLNTSEFYDVTSNVWSSAAPLPVPVLHPAAATLFGRLYLCGGMAEAEDELEDTAVMHDLVQVYNPHDDSWRSCARLLLPRSAAAAAVLDGKLYVTGGCHGFLSVTNKAERYDPKTDTWEEIAPMTTARQHHGMASLYGLLYVVAGVGGGGEQLASTEVYDPSTNSWHEAPPLPWPRAHLALDTITVKLDPPGKLNKD
ncbi:BTB/Kelch-associated [Trinorchestia longiramus]|nr:BTB/Kelch-associated [Trinorchestia longiramus]